MPADKSFKHLTINPHASLAHNRQKSDVLPFVLWLTRRPVDHPSADNGFEINIRVQR